MTAILFDTHKFVKEAKCAGFTEQQAEFQAKELSMLINEELATKTDILLIRKDIEHLKNEIIIKLGSLMVIGMGILGFILKH